MYEEGIEMKVKEEYKVPLSEIETAAYNPRKISVDALERLKQSIISHSAAMDGWDADNGYRLIDPVIVNKANNRLIGGHQRIKALKELGQDWIHKNDIRFVNVTDEKREKTLNVVLNNELAQGEWDYVKLQEIIKSLDSPGFDIEKALGMNEFDLKTLFNFEVPTWGEMDKVEGEFVEFPNKGKEKVFVEVSDPLMVEEVVKRIKQFCSETWPDKKLIVDQGD